MTTLDDGIVDQFLSLLDGTINRDQAIHILKLSNNNFDTAVEKYFSAGGPDGLQSLLEQPVGNVWDNSVFMADRYGQSDTSNSIPTFNIDYAPGLEHYPHSGGPSGAPTRPSSRTSHRSNVSTHAGDAPRQSVETEQESGVVGSGAAFGPAQQDAYYDNASWAMVPVSQSTEYVPDAALPYQSRSRHQPAILKPSTGPDYLPALLTILHSIPLYRNALLCPKLTIDNYWSGNEWWKGNAEPQPHTIDGNTASASSDEQRMVYEIQRLMAFLDDTERSYASLEAFFQLDAWKQPNSSLEEQADDDLVKFLLKWSQSYKHHHPDVELDGVFRSTINIGSSVQQCFVLDVEVPAVSNEAFIDRHLYDVLDTALFDSSVHSAHISNASDVLIFRLRSTQDRLDCVIPAILYADRYLEENKPFVEDMFAKKKRHEGEIIQADREIDKFQFYKPKKPELPSKLNSLDMIKASMKAFETEAGGGESGYGVALAQLKSLYERVEQKLASLQDEKQKACDTYQEVSQAFRASINEVDKPVDGDSSRVNKHAYKLQGVATSSTDYYLLHPEKKSEDASETQSRQWWHVKYDYTNGDDATIVRNPVTVDNVCADASANSGKVLLVYANDAALTVDYIQLSKPLQDFVQADNAVLVDDIDRHTTAWEDYDPQEGLTPLGGWDMADDAVRSDGQEPPEYDDWNAISAKEFHRANSYDYKGFNTTVGGDDGGNDADSTMSSTTLTPNTDIDDDDDIQAAGSVIARDTPEMKEINGGIAAWAGTTSNASSETVGIEPMNMIRNGQTQSSKPAIARTAGDGDVNMQGVQESEAVKPETQHTEKTTADKTGS
ncbi:unnamed protein product [Periconia digitata]|uniref:Ubiquitin interaction motif protein n=1 Tax=Periconia digitata TaxID=1303443 RepID=A0A9W4XLZ1_9PLEO|nr:unnamed protein product [Periconia digitata]